MPKKIFLLTAFFVCYLFIIFPLSPYSRDAKITDVVVTNDANHVTVYARVTNCFTKKIESAILAGVPTTFTFLLELYEEKENWIDKKVSSVVVSQTIKYDNVKKIFDVSSTANQKTSIFQDFNSAKKAMSDINGISVGTVEDLRTDKNYYVKVKAKLDQVRLPLRMEYVLIFVSLWDFETNWYRQKLVY